MGSRTSIYFSAITLCLYFMATFLSNYTQAPKASRSLCSWCLARFKNHLVCLDLSSLFFNIVKQLAYSSPSALTAFRRVMATLSSDDNVCILSCAGPWRSSNDTSRYIVDSTARSLSPYHSSRRLHASFGPLTPSICCFASSGSLDVS